MEIAFSILLPDLRFSAGTAASCRRGHARAKPGSSRRNLPNPRTSTSLTTVWFGFAWAKRASGIEAAAIAAGACALWYELVIFSPRALTEVLAAHILLPGLYLGAHAEGRWEKCNLFLAGLLCGLAMSLRIQLFPAVAVAGLYFCRSRWRAKIPAVLAGILLPVAVFGAVDAIT